MRSKSELTVANLLYALGIAYEYAPMVRLGSTAEEADFLVRSKLDRGKAYNWEHGGRMEEREYGKRFGRKMERYRTHGYREGKNLIVTYEDEESGLDTQELLTVLAAMGGVLF